MEADRRAYRGAAAGQLEGALPPEAESERRHPRLVHPGDGAYRVEGRHHPRAQQPGVGLQFDEGPAHLFAVEIAPLAVHVRGECDVSQGGEISRAPARVVVDAERGVQYQHGRVRSGALLEMRVAR